VKLGAFHFCFFVVELETNAIFSPVKGGRIKKIFYIKIFFLLFMIKKTSVKQMPKSTVFF